MDTNIGCLRASLPTMLSVRSAVNTRSRIPMVAVTWPRSKGRSSSDSQLFVVYIVLSSQMFLVLNGSCVRPSALRDIFHSPILHLVGLIDIKLDLHSSDCSISKMMRTRRRRVSCSSVNRCANLTVQDVLDVINPMPFLNRAYGLQSRL